MHRTILNTTKQQWMTIGIVLLAFIILYYFVFKKKKAESSFRMATGRVGTCGPGFYACGMNKTGCCQNSAKLSPLGRIFSKNYWNGTEF